MHPTSDRSSQASAPTPAYLGRLLDVCLALSSETDLDRLLTVIIETAAEVLDCAAASILLFDETAGRLRFAAATGSDSAALAAIPVPLHGSLAGVIFRENRPLRVDDPSRDTRHFGAVGEAVSFQPDALIGVPLQIHGRPIGVLEALNPHGGRFAPGSISTLAVIAAQAAVAVRNAQQQRALRHAYDDLSRLDRMKSDFMSIASHELRTPLATVLGYATVLAEEAPLHLAEFATATRQATEQACRVVEAMGHLSQTTDSTDPLDAQRILVQYLVHRAADALDPALQARCVRLDLDLATEPAWVMAEMDHLHQAITAVLDNAVAFSPEGATVSVRLGVCDDRVEIDVTDDGPGLDPGDLERIFQPFYQVQDVLTRTHEGAGLGLTLARRFLGFHGGDITAHSDGIGRGGCTFRLRLPALPSAA